MHGVFKIYIYIYIIYMYVRIMKMYWLTHRSLFEDLVEILVRSSRRGPCMKIWQMPCSRGSCMKTLGRFSNQGLLRSSPAAASGPFMTILWESLRAPANKRSLWNPLRGPCMIAYRSVWEDLVEILLKSSSRGLCSKIVEDALHWCLCESSSAMFVENYSMMFF